MFFIGSDTEQQRAGMGGRFVRGKLHSPRRR